MKPKKETVFQEGDLVTHLNDRTALGRIVGVYSQWGVDVVWDIPPAAISTLLDPVQYHVRWLVPTTGNAQAAHLLCQ